MSMSSYWRWMFGAAALATLTVFPASAFPYPASTVSSGLPAVSLRYLPAPAAVGSGVLSDPAIYNGMLALGGGPPTTPRGQSFLYTAGLRNWRPRALFETRPPDTLVGSVHLSATWLTWLQFGGLAWTLYAKSLRSTNLYVIASSSGHRSSPADALSPVTSLSGDTVAWSFSVCAASCNSPSPRITSTVMARTLPFGRPIVVRQTTGNCLADWPSVAQRNVAFQMEGRCWGSGDKRVGSDIYLYDRTTRRVRPLTRNHGSSEPVTNGTFVAWKQAAAGGNRFTDGAIILLNLTTNKRTTVSVRMTQKHHPICWPKNTRIQKCADSPVISPRVLEWTIDDGSVIIAMDLRTHKEYVVFRETGKVGGLSPYRPENAWSNRIVYRVTRPWPNGNTRDQEIVVATIP